LQALTFYANLAVVDSQKFGIVQRIADLLAVVAAFALGYWYYTGWEGYPIPYTCWQFVGLGLGMGWLLILVLQSFGLYEGRVSLLHVSETRKLLLGWGITVLALFASSFYLRTLDLSRVMVSVSLLASLLLLLVERSVFYHLLLLARSSSVNSKPVVIFGAGVVGRHLFKRIYHSPALGLRVVGFLDDNEDLWGKEVHIGEIRRKVGNTVLGGLNFLQELKEKNGIKELFLALPNATQDRSAQIVNACRKFGLAFSVIPPSYGFYLHDLEVDDIGGIPIIREKSRRRRLVYPVLKKIFDLTVSAFAVTLLSPLFLLLAIIVRLDSAGPVFFRHKRVGLNGKEFDFLKFRTMYVTSSPYAVTPQSGEDPRITKFGRWLRRSSLDELPQFFNVLKGDMSIVGPRPEMPFIVNGYTPEQRERLKVKPGITGVWQISAVRGEPIHANMEYDLFYIEHRSMLLDLIITIKTILTAIRGIGAV
jgi:exopolysaccharide biosynthesis polyprenyl glycosylphosphotransferase